LGGILAVLAGIAVLSFGSSIAAAASEATNSQEPSVTQRVAARKNSLKLQLTAAQSQKLAKNCTSAQKRLKNIADQDEAKAAKRKQVYTNISARLAKVSDGLSRKGVDITDLTKLQQQFNTSANQYLIDASDYESSLDDLSQMDCSSDPAGFEVTLMSARQLRIKMASDTGQVASAKTSIAQAVTKAAEALNNKQGAN
jgi:hypothetical protein